MQKTESKTTIYFPMNNDTFAVFAKLREEIESSLTPNRCCDADEIATRIDELIVQRIKQMVKP